jgi:hypothetical protein
LAIQFFQRDDGLFDVVLKKPAAAKFDFQTLLSEQLRHCAKLGTLEREMLFGEKGLVAYADVDALAPGPHLARRYIVAKNVLVFLE